MLKNYASTNNKKRRFRQSKGLFLIFYAILSSGVFAQNAPDLEAPFKKCSAIAPGNGTISILASDNNQNIYYTNNETSIISKDQTSQSENWRTLTGGNILTNAYIDDDSLYFLTYFEDSEKERIISVNSLSLKTGLINWQKKITEIKETGNLKIHNKTPKNPNLYITGGNRLIAIDKANGKHLWSKSFPVAIQSIEDSEDENISVLTAEMLYTLSGKSGEEVHNKPSSKSAINFLNNGSELILGYRTGEIIKTRRQDRRNEAEWTIKTGGSVTGLYEYKDRILVTSLDNFVYMLSKENGNLKWKKRVSGRLLIKPLINKNHAVILPSGDSIATIINLEEGKSVNQIRIEEDNYFSGESYISGNFLILQTLRGIYYFTNTNKNCN